MYMYIHRYTHMHVSMCAHVCITRKAPEVAACALEALTTRHP